MSTYYVNISNGINVGDGSSTSAFNYNQLVNFFNPDYIIDAETVVTTATSGDVVKIKGTKTTDFLDLSGTGIVDTFVTFNETLSGSIEIEGWDVENNGSPILYSRNSYFILFDRGFELSAYSELDVTFKNFMIDTYDEDNVTYINNKSTSGGVNNIYKKINIDFKTVAIKSYNLQHISNDVTSGDVSALSNYNFYGCTLDVSAFQNLVSIDTLGIYDSILINEVVDLDMQSYSTLKADNNLTTYVDYVSGVGNPNIVDFVEPELNGNLLNYLTKVNAIEQIEYYQTKTSMEYASYNVTVGGATSAFRNTNDYNTGLFDEVRTTYGAYVFELTENEYLQGHIGAFYFGGDYENVNIVVTPGVIQISPVSSGSVDTSANNSFGTINIVVPQVQAFGFDSFPFNFSGTPVDGSSPLYVRYNVYDYEARGRYEGVWEPYEFRWWFDYATSGGANNYVTCASDTAEWLYCGVYGDKYDVRCCVMYRYI